MKNLNDTAKELSDLRQRAEMQLQMNGTASQLSESETQKLINELKVHQIELEMQLGELAQTNSRLKNIIEATQTGVWEWNIQTNEIVINDVWAQIIGFTTEDLGQLNATSFRTMVHPDDLKDGEVLMERHLSGEIPYFDFEGRMKHKHGHWVWIHDRGCVTARTDEGIPMMMLGTHIDITERKRAEAALKISLDRNKALLGANPDLMFVFDSSCRITDFHTESIDQLYAQPDFFLNKTVDEVFPPEISRMTHQCVNAVLSTGKPDYSTYELPSGDISRSFESRYVLCGKNEVLSIVRDITDRKMAEEALLKRKQQYDNLVSKIPVGVYILHSKPDGAFALDYASPRMAEMLNLSVENLLTDNNSIFKAIHPDDLDGFRTLNQEGIYQNRPFNWIGRIVAYGNIKWMHFRSTPEPLGNGEILWHGLIVDVTERKQAEQEIKLKNDELSELVAEKDRFFSIVAHDLRSPFNVLLGLTQLLDEDLPNMNLDETQRMASALRDSALSVFNLLENLLEWSRIKRGATSFAPESFLLTTKIDEFLQPVLELANKKSIEISYRIPDDLAVFADLNMMGSIIRNLASNAVKFTQKNGSIFLSAQITEDNSVEISMRDSGIGMTKSILDKLFNFDRNNNRRGTDGESSSGLGLIICKEFIEKHGGRIWVKSQKEKGSTFYLTLPHKKSNE